MSLFNNSRICTGSARSRRRMFCSDLLTLQTFFLSRGKRLRESKCLRTASDCAGVAGGGGGHGGGGGGGRGAGGKRSCIRGPAIQGLGGPNCCMLVQSHIQSWSALRQYRHIRCRRHLRFLSCLLRRCASSAIKERTRSGLSRCSHTSITSSAHLGHMCVFPFLARRISSGNRKSPMGTGKSVLPFSLGSSSEEYASLRAFSPRL